MRSRDLRSTPEWVALVAVWTMTLGSCQPVDAPSERAAGGQPSLAERLFTEETFGGNGRVCSTCHEPDRFGTITPELVREQFASDPEGPLFRATDSDDGLGLSYRRRQEHATIRIPMELPRRTASGFGIRKCDAPGEAKVTLHRGNPSVFNVVLDTHLMHDGRERDDLETQALNAVITHAEPGRDPTPEELAAIAAFQASLYSPRSSAV